MSISSRWVATAQSRSSTGCFIRCDLRLSIAAVMPRPRARPAAAKGETGGKNGGGGGTNARYRGSRVRPDKPSADVTAEDFFTVAYSGHKSMRTATQTGRPLNSRQESFAGNLRRMGFDVDPAQAERLARMGGAALADVVNIGDGGSAEVPRRKEQAAGKKRTAVEKQGSAQRQAAQLSPEQAARAGALAAVLDPHARHGVLSTTGLQVAYSCLTCARSLLCQATASSPWLGARCCCSTGWAGSAASSR